MKALRTNPARVVQFIAAALVLVAGCDRAADPSSAALSLENAVSEVHDDELSIVVLGNGRYTIGIGGDPILDRQLESALQTAAAERTPRPTTLVLYTPADLDRSAKGYNALVAMNAAARAGFATVRAVDNFKYGASEEERKAWVSLPELDLTERLERLDSRSTHADSSSH